MWSSLTSVIKTRRHYLSKFGKGERKRWHPSVWTGTAHRWSLEKRRAYALQLCERLNRELA